MYTRFKDENQGACDRYRGPADLFPEDVWNTGKKTKPELALRRALHARGSRFRLHSGKVHGRPDLVLPKHRAVVFVHGCFWHRHEGCRYTTSPSTRPEFWQTKFEANIARDSAVCTTLLEDGWRVATIWECALRKRAQISATTDLLVAWLPMAPVTIEIGESDILHGGIIATGGDRGG